MRRQGLTAEQVDEAVRLYETGWSLARIGEQTAVDHTTVWHRLRERGVRMPGYERTGTMSRVAIHPTYRLFPAWGYLRPFNIRVTSRSLRPQHLAVAHPCPR
jgi:hypothetical protein